MSTLTNVVKDRLRTMLKIRKPRSLQRRGPKPSVGAKIFREDVRITVQAGLSHELWRWLQGQGWREVMFRPDRRRYRDVPSRWVTRLIDCSPDERDAVLSAAIERASFRSGPATVAPDAVGTPADSD
jgi:hypothetical protein